MSGNLTKNPVVRVLFVLLLLFIAVVIVAQVTAKRAVADFLERKLPHHVRLKYENMDANVLSGTIGLRDITLDFYDRDSMLLNTKVTMDAITLENLGYWDFLVNSKIDVRRLLLERPQMRHYPYRVLPKKDNETEGVVQLLKVISIQELSVRNGSLDLLRDDKDSTAVALRNLNFIVENASTGPDQIVKKIPVDYGNYELTADSLYVNLGPYEKLDVATLLWNREAAKITGLQLRSKYDKIALSKHLMKERDHVDLTIREMRLDSIRFGFEKDTFFIATGKGMIDKPALELYRDKFVADDETKKPLYSQSIRQLPIHIDVPEIEIVNGKVVYSELVADIPNPGKLSFEKLNATLSNISNTYPPGENTLIKANTKFMGEADMTLDWSFDVNRTSDAFFASGTVSNFNTASINPFLESNARVKASGSIDQLYFTINGNSISSSGDMKMNYRDFRFQVLKKNRLGINKVLTTIGNLFVDDGSKTDEEGFRYGSISAERDATKSFFSYLWLNVRNGTLSTLTGDGEKD
ncbi:hypothetical protein [Pricia sp.]|uniref:hypothetical protein n=1 Tax=Pricia sp. TaxID=2268138 RepID=UPI0035939312